MNASNHKAEVLHEIKKMNRKQIERRLAVEENAAVRIGIWQYLQTV